MIICGVADGEDAAGELSDGIHVGIDFHQFLWGDGTEYVN